MFDASLEVSSQRQIELIAKNNEHSLSRECRQCFLNLRWVSPWNQDVFSLLCRGEEARNALWGIGQRRNKQGLGQQNMCRAHMEETTKTTKHQMTFCSVYAPLYEKTWFPPKGFCPMSRSTPTGRPWDLRTSRLSAVSQAWTRALQLYLQISAMFLGLKANGRGKEQTASQGNK